MRILFIDDPHGASWPHGLLRHVGYPHGDFKAVKFAKKCYDMLQNCSTADLRESYDEKTQATFFHLSHVQRGVIAIHFGTFRILSFGVVIGILVAFTGTGAPTPIPSIHIHIETLEPWG